MAEPEGKIAVSRRQVCGFLEPITRWTTTMLTKKNQETVTIAQEPLCTSIPRTFHTTIELKHRRSQKPDFCDDE
jgi:hypothetical protein